MTPVLPVPAARDVDRFRTFVTRRFGFDLDDGKLTLLGEVLARRVEASGCTCDVFLDQLEAERRPADVRDIAVDLTVPETYFFRNHDSFRALASVVLPARLRAPARPGHLSILSAGCASGEEPYTLAMVVRDAKLAPSWTVSIVGVDLNRAMLARAAAGRYTKWSLRETPPEAQRRWFRQDGADLVVVDEIRQAVRFEERNLIEGHRAPWPPGTFDVVFWRNVMMYFTPENARLILDRITRAIAPGGFLFLGHAETLRGLTNEFHLRHTHGTFYYQRKLESERNAPSDDRAIEREESSPASTLHHGSADSWLDTIQRASQRIATLADDARTPDPPQVSVAPPSSVAPSAPSWSLALARELLEKERFADALAVVDALPSASALDPQALLLRAALLTHSGQLAAAQQVATALLDVDELDAGAHYLLALCREGVGDRGAATDHDQIAVYLDPGFAMPRLHLGLLARRANDRDGARRDLGQALLLLQREDASRLLLFGGGFRREALITLCRAELRACGGSA